MRVEGDSKEVEPASPQNSPHWHGWRVFFGALDARKCLKTLAPQVGLEPTTLRLTIAAASFTAGCCDCMGSAETAPNRAFRHPLLYCGLLPFSEQGPLPINPACFGRTGLMLFAEFIRGWSSARVPTATTRNHSSRHWESTQHERNGEACSGRRLVGAGYHPRE